jgi:hypothetical protein
MNIVKPPNICLPFNFSFAFRKKLEMDVKMVMLWRGFQIHVRFKVEKLMASILGFTIFYIRKLREGMDGVRSHRRVI